MYLLWKYLIALGAATSVPEYVRAAGLHSSLFQQLPAEKKVEAVRSAVSLLSLKAALLAAENGKEKAVLDEGEAQEAQITYRDEDSNLEKNFLRAIDCELGLETTGVCEAEGHRGNARGGAATETSSEALPLTTTPTAAITDTAPLVLENENGNSSSSGGGSLDLKASLTISALQADRDNLLNDTDLLTYLGRRAAGLARDFFKAAADGRLLEPSSKLAATDFDEERVGEAVRLAGKFLSSLHLTVTPTSFALDGRTDAEAGRRLTHKKSEGIIVAEQGCKPKGGKKCGGEPKVKSCSKHTGKCWSEAKGRCGLVGKDKCKSEVKKKCDKSSSSPLQQSLLIEPAPITATALPLFTSYPLMLQPQMMPLQTNLPVMGPQVLYGVNNVGTTGVSTEGSGGAPLYQDGVLSFFPVAQGVTNGLYHFNGYGTNLGAEYYIPSGTSEGVYPFSSSGPLPSWRSSQFLPRLTAYNGNSLLQEIPPFFSAPLAAINTHVQESPLLSPLYRSALGRFFFNAEDVTHQDELKNFSMTPADLY